MTRHPPVFVGLLTSCATIFVFLLVLNFSRFRPLFSTGVGPSFGDLKRPRDGHTAAQRLHHGGYINNSPSPDLFFSPLLIINEIDSLGLRFVSGSLFQQPRVFNNFSASLSGSVRFAFWPDPLFSTTSPVRF